MGVEVVSPSGEGRCKKLSLSVGMVQIKTGAKCYGDTEEVKSAMTQEMRKRN